MKRIVWLLCVALLLTLSLPTSATSGGTISEDEARQLIGEAGKYIIKARALRYLDENDLFSSIVNYEDKLTAYPDGVPENKDYYLVDESLLPGGSYENMKAFADTVFTDDLAPKMYDVTFDYEDNLPHIIYGTDGRLYAQPAINWDFRTAGVMGGADSFWSGDFQIEIVSGDENSAIFYVRSVIGYDGPQLASVYDVECEFVKIADGWRIADCVFTDMYRYGINYDMEWMDEGVHWIAFVDDYYNPPTSDSDASRAVIFAGVGALALWGAVAVVNRRRRPSL